MITRRIGEFYTCQCNVRVMETDLFYGNEKIYIVQSTHRENGKVNIRFGNLTQITGIVNTYANKTWTYKTIDKIKNNWLFVD